jgi:hypothetical protein
MKTLQQIYEATVLYNKDAQSGSSKKISKELKKVHTQTNKKWGTYNPAPKLFKTAQKLGFRRVQVGQGSLTTKNDKGQEVTEHYPTHHMTHPVHAGHHVIISSKGFVHRTPEGGITAGPHAGSLLNSLGRHKDFKGAIETFKIQRDAKRAARNAAMAHAKSMPTE